MWLAQIIAWAPVTSKANNRLGSSVKHLQNEHVVIAEVPRNSLDPMELRIAKRIAEIAQTFCNAGSFNVTCTVYY